jgi:hypothetical protein
MTAENELPLDEAANEELQDEELDDLAGGILCTPPQQVTSEHTRVL